jgi:tetratricopeptide (TPR) repeat protein
VLVYPFVLIHEMGHVLAARAVGLEVYGVLFGTGRHVGFISLFGVPVQIRVVPFTGLTFHSQPIRFRRLRSSLVIVSGPAINLLVACTAFAVAEVFNEDFWSGAAFFIDVALANLILGVTNLVPFVIGRLGVASDGLRLFQVISGRSKAPADPWNGRAAILRASFLYQWGRFEAAEAVLARLAGQYPFDIGARMLRSAVAAQLGRVDEALADTRKLLSEPSPSAGFGALNHELLAWLLLIAGRPSDGEEALRSAWKSFLALQWEPWCRFTCGWAEAVHGDARIAIELLDPLLGAGEGAHMEAGLYAAKALAEARRGDKVASLRAFARARRLAPRSRYVAVASSQLNQVAPLSATDLGATIRPELVPVWRSTKKSARPIETDAGPSGRIAGALLLVAGLAILSFCGFVIYKIAAPGRVGHPDYLFLAGLVAFGALCARIGWPLAANRPNRYYSILTPPEWQGVGIALVAATCWLLKSVAQHGIGKAAESLVSTALLAGMAFGSFYMGRRVKRRLTPGAPF